MATVTSLKASAQDELKGFSGELIGPEDGNYDEVRAVYNAMIDRRPGLIARCHSADDVAAVVNYARNHGTLLAVRGGGHNGGGLGTCDDGVVIDLSPMNGDHRRPGGQDGARRAAACVWGEVDRGHQRARAGHAQRRSSRPPASAGSRSAAASATSRRTLRPDASTTCSRRRWCWPTARSCAPAPTRTRTCSGRCAAAAATSASSPSFDVPAATRSATCSPGPTFWPLEQAAEVLRCVPRLPAGAPRELNGFFAFLTRAARPAVPGGAPPAQGRAASSGATPAPSRRRRPR